MYYEYETCSRYDVTELIRPSLFSPGHDFKSSTLNPNISGSIYLFEEWYISFELSCHGEFLKKKWWLWHMHFKNICQISLKTRMKKTVPLMITIWILTQKLRNSEVNELQILYNAAMILRDKVQEIPKLNFLGHHWHLIWQCSYNVKKVVPCELYNMLA